LHDDPFGSAKLRTRLPGNGVFAFRLAKVVIPVGTGGAFSPD
jgi:hypothetical protein